MIAENVKLSLQTLIAANVNAHSALSGIPVYLNGDTQTPTFPLIVFVDDNTAQIEQDGVIMRGVDSITMHAEIQSIPVDEDQSGSTMETHRAIAKAVYQVLADQRAVSFCSGLNGTTIFDIRASSPTMQEPDGRRVSTIQLTVIACPLTQ